MRGVRSFAAVAAIAAVGANAQDSTTIANTLSSADARAQSSSQTTASATSLAQSASSSAEVSGTSTTALGSSSAVSSDSSTSMSSAASSSALTSSATSSGPASGTSSSDVQQTATLSNGDTILINNNPTFNNNPVKSNSNTNTNTNGNGGNGGGNGNNNNLGGPTDEELIALIPTSLRSTSGSASSTMMSSTSASSSSSSVDPRAVSSTETTGSASSSASSSSSGSPGSSSMSMTTSSSASSSSPASSSGSSGSSSMSMTTSSSASSSSPASSSGSSSMSMMMGTGVSSSMAPQATGNSTLPFIPAGFFFVLPDGTAQLSNGSIVPRDQATGLDELGNNSTIIVGNTTSPDGTALIDLGNGTTLVTVNGTVVADVMTNATMGGNPVTSFINATDLAVNGTNSNTTATALADILAAINNGTNLAAINNGTSSNTNATALADILAAINNGTNLAAINNGTSDTAQNSIGDPLNPGFRPFPRLPPFLAALAEALDVTDPSGAAASLLAANGSAPLKGTVEEALAALLNGTNVTRDPSGNLIVNGSNGTHFEGNRMDGASAGSHAEQGRPNAPFVHQEGSFIFQNGSAVTNGQITDAVKNNGFLPGDVFLVKNGTQGVETHPVYGIHPTPVKEQHPRITDLFLNNQTAFEVHPNGTLEFHPNNTSVYAPHPRITDITMNQTYFDFVNGTLNFPETHPVYNNTITKTKNPNIIDIVTGDVHPTYYNQNATLTKTEHPRITDIGTGNIGTGNVHPTVYQNNTLTKTQNPLITDIMTGGTPKPTQIVNGTIVTPGDEFVFLTETIRGQNNGSTKTRTLSNPRITDMGTVTRGDEFLTLTQTIFGQNNGSTETRTLSNPRITDVGTGVFQTVETVQTQIVNGTVVFDTATQVIPGSSEYATLTRSQNPIITDLVYNTTIVNPQTSYISQVTEQIVNNPSATITRGQEIITVITQSNGQPLTVVQTQPTTQGQNFGTGSQAVGTPQTIVQQQTLVANNTIVRTEVRPAASTVETRVVGGTTQTGGNVVGGTTVVQSAPQNVETQAVNTPVGPGASFSQAPFGNATAPAPPPGVPQTQPAPVVEITRAQGKPPAMQKPNGQIFQQLNTQVNQPMVPGATHGPVVNQTIPAVPIVPQVSQTQPAPVVEITRTQGTPPVMQMADGQIFQQLTTPILVVPIVPQVSQPAPVVEITHTQGQPPVMQMTDGQIFNHDNNQLQKGHQLHPVMRRLENVAGQPGVAQPSGPAPRPEQPIVNVPSNGTTSIVPGQQTPQTPQQPGVAQPSGSAPRPEQPIAGTPGSNTTVPTPGRPVENVVPSTPTQNIPPFNNGTTPIVPGQQTPGVAQPSGSAPRPEQPVVGTPGSNTTVPTPGRSAENVVPTTPAQNIPPFNNGTNSIVPGQQTPQTPQQPGVAQPSGTAPRPEQPNVKVPSNGTTPIVPGVAQPSGAARPSGYNPVQQLPDGQIQNVPLYPIAPAQNGTTPQQPGVAQPSAGTTMNPIGTANVAQPSGAARPSGYNPVQQLPDGQIQNVPLYPISPAHNGTQTQQPGVAQPSRTAPRPEQPIVNVPSNGTTPQQPGVAHPSGVAASGYNPVQQLPDGQIQNVPVDPTYPTNPTYPVNPAQNGTTPGEVVGNTPGMKGPEGQEGGMPPMATAPATRSAGNKLVKGAGSAFAAVVAMLVMSAV